MWVITGAAPSAPRATREQRPAAAPAEPHSRRKDDETGK